MAASLAEVRSRLQDYADRGVFRGLAEQPARGGRHRFSFRWLAPTPFILVYDPAAGTLIFRDLLPNVGSRSHRWPARSAGSFRAAPLRTCRRTGGLIRPAPACDARVRRGALTVELVAKPAHHGYGVNRAINLVHELFVHLHTYHPEYMWENFDASQE